MAVPHFSRIPKKEREKSASSFNMPLALLIYNHPLLASLATYTIIKPTDFRFDEKYWKQIIL